MITLVTKAEHSYTLTKLLEFHKDNDIFHVSYEELLETAELISLGTWIFTDLERLSVFEKVRAAEIANQIRRNGGRVLNHPAEVRTRFEILRRLKNEGINSFSVYRCDSDPKPLRFPVFIRNSYDHTSSAESMPLIYDQCTLDTVIAEYESNGEVLTGKLVIEFRGEQSLVGVWRRYSSYCVGDRILAHHIAHDTSWVVKDGFNSNSLQSHPHKNIFLNDEAVFIYKNQFASILLRACRIAGISYGRLDFGLTGDSIQVYEINTNPTHSLSAITYNPDIIPERLHNLQFSEERLQREILNLSTPGIKKIRIKEHKSLLLIRTVKKISSLLRRELRGL